MIISSVLAAAELEFSRTGLWSMVGMLDLLHHYHLLSKHFRLQLFFPKDSVSLVFAKLSDSVRWPHGRQQRENV